MNRPFLLIVVFVVVASAPFAQARYWTDTRGNRINAKFVRVHEGNVVLSRAGRVVMVPFTNLSPGDQDYVRKELEAKGQEHLLPPATQRPELPGDVAGLDPTDPLGSTGGEAIGAVWAEPERTWTDARGRTIEAAFLGVSGDKVVLRKDGKEVSYPYSALSAEDQQYVREKLEARGQGSRIAALEGRQPADESMPGGAMPGMPGGEMPGMPGMAGVPGMPGGPSRGMPGPAGMGRAGGGRFPGGMGPARGMGFPGGAGFPGGTRPSGPGSGMPIPGMPPMGTPSPHSGGPFGPHGQGYSPGGSPAPEMPDSSAFGPGVAGGPGYPGPSDSLPEPSMPGSSIPSGPDMTTFPQASGGPVLTQVVEYRCTKCNAVLSASVKAGDRCPNCNAYLAYSEEPDGTRTYAGMGPLLGRGVMGAGVLVVIAIVVGFFIKLVRGD